VDYQESVEGRWVQGWWWWRWWW